MLYFKKMVFIIVSLVLSTLAKGHNEYEWQNKEYEKLDKNYDELMEESSKHNGFIPLKIFSTSKASQNII